MNQKVYRLPPTRPVVWRTPHDMQVGIDAPFTSVSGVPSNATPILHALTEGLSEGGLGVMQRQLRLSPTEVSELMDQLAPALIPVAPAPDQELVIVGRCPALPVMAGVLDAMGVAVRRVHDIQEITHTTPAGVLLVADYLIHPDWIGVLGSTNIPHTPVVFSDLTIRVGPRIDPGQTPCLSCVEQQQRKQSPHWLAINSQLWDTVSPLSTPDCGARAAALVALCHGLLGSTPQQLGGSPGLAIDYRPAAPSLSTRIVEFDTDCTCRGLSAPGFGDDSQRPEESTHLPL